MADSPREIVRGRAGARCEYCRLPDAADEWPFHVDHIIPRQHGGGDELENLCWTCSRCNLYKGPNLSGLESQAASPITLFQPRKDAWSDHFRVEAGRVIGLTPRGRVTVRLLVMNASSRVELRRRLSDLGS